MNEQGSFHVRLHWPL